MNIANLKEYKNYRTEKYGNYRGAFFDAFLNYFFMSDDQVAELIFLLHALIEDDNKKNIDKFIEAAAIERNPTKFRDQISYHDDVIEFKRRLVKESVNVLLGKKQIPWYEQKSHWLNPDDKFKTHDRWLGFATVCSERLDALVAEYITPGDNGRFGVYDMINELLVIAHVYPEYSHLYTESLFSKYMYKIAEGVVQLALDKNTEDYTKISKLRGMYRSNKMIDVGKTLTGATTAVVTLSMGFDKITKMGQIRTLRAVVDNDIAKRGAGF
jgi:hypothetical protein